MHISIHDYRCIDKIHTILKDENNNDIILGTTNRHVLINELLTNDHVVIDVITSLLQDLEKSELEALIRHKDIIKKVEYRDRTRDHMSMCKDLPNEYMIINDIYIIYTTNCITSEEFMKQIDKKGPIQCTFGTIHTTLGSLTNEEYNNIYHSANIQCNLIVSIVENKVYRIEKYRLGKFFNSHRCHCSINEFCEILDEINIINSFDRDFEKYFEYKNRINHPKAKSNHSMIQ